MTVKEKCISAYKVGREVARFSIDFVATQCIKSNLQTPKNKAGVVINVIGKWLITDYITKKVLDGTLPTEEAFGEWFDEHVNIVNEKKEAAESERGEEEDNAE